MLGLTALLRAQRHRLAVLVLLLTLATAVVAAHSVVADEHMSEAGVMCLAVLGAGAGAAALAIARARPGPLPRATAVAAPAAPWSLRPPEPAARAGPSVLQVFRL